MSLLAKQAFEEYCSPITTAHHGGVNGRPFWNIHSTQFMFNPCFQFPWVPGCNKYLFTATDCNKTVHTFKAESPMSLLTPIWGELPEGIVELKVEALDESDKPWTLAGARSFYKCSPYPGPEYYPPKARSYRECALMAYRYIFNQPFIQHWLSHGTPDTEYDFYVYPSKTISAIIDAMLRYAQLEPEHAEDAIKIAVKAADFLISISFAEGKPLEGLPPTYYIDFRKNLEKKLEEYNNETAVERLDGLMIMYPAMVGLEYLKLEEITGEKRFYEAAKRIADYFRTHVLPNGSWYLFLSVKTGENIAHNYCTSNSIMEFMNKMYKRTGDVIWNELEQNFYKYIVKNCLETYNWEGQFEDSDLSSNYSNLSHYPATDMLHYITCNKSNEPEAILEAEDLMRFVEDQFVVWKNFAPWNHKSSPKHGTDITQWFSPAGLEQYGWAMPIDASTSDIMSAFLDMYKVKNDPLLLAKACTLGDMITRMQNPENGLIPTHWMRNTCISDGGNLWINCMIKTASSMLDIAEITEKTSN